MVVDVSQRDAFSLPCFQHLVVYPFLLSLLVLLLVFTLEQLPGSTSLFDASVTGEKQLPSPQPILKSMDTRAAPPECILQEDVLNQNNAHLRISTEFHADQYDAG